MPGASYIQSKVLAYLRSGILAEHKTDLRVSSLGEFDWR